VDAGPFFCADFGGGFWRWAGFLFTVVTESSLFWEACVGRPHARAGRMRSFETELGEKAATTFRVTLSERYGDGVAANVDHPAGRFARGLFPQHRLHLGYRLNVHVFSDNDLGHNCPLLGLCMVQ
jgi:hypothetical protein